MISATTVDQLQDRLAKLNGKRVLLVLFPNHQELAAPTPHYLQFRQALHSAMNGCCQLLEVREQPDWNATLYRDDIHPSATGNQVLADLLEKQLALP